MSQYNEFTYHTAAKLVQLKYNFVTHNIKSKDIKHHCPITNMLVGVNVNDVRSKICQTLCDMGYPLKCSLFNIENILMELLYLSYQNENL